MIMKPLEMPEYLLQLEALNLRLPPNHPKKEVVEERLSNEKTGFKGEQAITYPLSLLPQNDFFIFRNLRLKGTSDYYFQLDTLILSPFLFFIIEIKNLYGTLIFDTEFDQLIRVRDDNIEEGFQNPIGQVGRQKAQLISWLNQHFGQNIPVETIVVISFPNTIIKSTSSNQKIREQVCHSGNLTSRINQIKDKYNRPILNIKELKKISKRLLKAQVPFKEDVLKKFSIQRSELISGVKCIKCSHIPMIRIKGKWKCPNCFFSSKEGHQLALKDYDLLIGNTITNQEAKEFLNLTSSSTAKRLLMSMDLSYSGKNKGRKYILNLKKLS